jgi:hypothetical protein
LKSQEPSNIREDELPGDSIEKILKIVAIPLERFKNLKKILMEVAPKNFFMLRCSISFSTKPINGFTRRKKRKRYPKKEATA